MNKKWSQKTLDELAKVIITEEFPHNAWTVRRYLDIMYGWKCSICFNSEWQNDKIPLVMDHVDGNSSNWSMGNLRFVCPNCDAQLPTFKGRNRGKGRFSRAERYRSGLSY